MLASSLKLRCGSSIRYFSSVSVVQQNVKSQTKKKNYIGDNYIPKILRSKEDERAPKVPISSSNKKKSEGAAISRQHAAHLLSKLTGEEVDMHTIGPLSNTDIKFFKIADKKITCALLGTTPNQLLDSIVVDRTVKSFLGRGQLEKALMTARLAKDKGTVAMNRIVEWVLEQGKVNDALQIHSSRKKWGVLVNEQSLTILFDGCSSVRGPKGAPGLTVNQIEKLHKILSELKDGYKFKLNMTHINSAFTALLNCSDQTIAFKAWDDWNSKKIFSTKTPNTKTYTIMLQALGHGPSDMWVFIQSEKILQNIIKLPKSSQDRKLYEAYVFAYLRCSRIDFIQRGLDAARAFFQLEVKATKSKFKNAIDNKNIRNVAEKIDWKPVQDLKEKWIPSASLVDILMKAYIQIGEYCQAQNLFKNFEELYPSQVDLPLIHRSLIVLREVSKANAGEETIKLYKALANEEYRTRLRPNKKTRFMVFNAIYSQSLSTLNDKGLHAIGKESDHIFNLAEEFLEFIKGDAQSYELTGYLKAIRRLRLTKAQRDQVLARIETAKSSFKEELEHSTDHKSTKENIASILETETYISTKKEKKTALEKLDKIKRENYGSEQLHREALA